MKLSKHSGRSGNWEILSPATSKRQTENWKQREDFKSQNSSPHADVLILLSGLHSFITFPNSAGNRPLRTQMPEPVRDILKWHNFPYKKKVSGSSRMVSHYGYCEKIASRKLEVACPQEEDLLTPQFWTSKFQDWEINLFVPKFHNLLLYYFSQVSKETRFFSSPRKKKNIVRDIFWCGGGEIGLRRHYI